MYINNTSTYCQGLFGGNTGIIQNLNIQNTNMNVFGTNGAIVAVNQGDIINCASIDGQITSIAEESRTGGITGENAGIVRNCYNSTNIVATNAGSMHDGGIVGIMVNNGIIENCYNIGNITGVNISVGGICGARFGIIKNCYNVGKVEAGRAFGGILGWLNDEGNLINCYYLEGMAISGIIGVEDEVGKVETRSAEYMRTSDFVNLLGNSNWKLVAGANNGYPMLMWQEGTSITKISQITTGFEDRTVTLSGSDAVPTYNSAILNLNTNNKYYVEFDYRCISGTNTFDVDLWPDDLPQILPVATTTEQHGMWLVSSTSSNMQSCYLRFFDDIQESNESDIIITNITMYQIQ